MNDTRWHEQLSSCNECEKQIRLVVEFYLDVCILSPPKPEAVDVSPEVKSIQSTTLLDTPILLADVIVEDTKT